MKKRHALYITYTHTVRVLLNDAEATEFERRDRAINAAIAAEEEGRLSEKVLNVRMNSYDNYLEHLGTLPADAQVERTELIRIDRSPRG